LNEIELDTLSTGRLFRVLQVRDLLLPARSAAAEAAATDLRPLIHRGQERRAVVHRPAGVLRWRQCDEPRQVRVLGAQSIEYPRAQARSRELEDAAVHLDE